jgi:hypothetical protein
MLCSFILFNFCYVIFGRVSGKSDITCYLLHERSIMKVIFSVSHWFLFITSICTYKLFPESRMKYFPTFWPMSHFMRRGCSGSQKVGARKIARCHFRMPVLKVRSQFRSQLKNLQGANFFEPKLDDCMYLACSVSCVNGADLFVQMLMSVLYFCFSFRFHHQKQKDLYNLLQ